MSQEMQDARVIRCAAQGYLRQAVGMYQPEPDGPAVEAFAAFAARALRQVEAKYWIDRRDDFASAGNAGRYVMRRLREEAAKAKGEAMIKGEIKPKGD